MKEHFNKYKYVYFIVFIVLIIGIPLAIQRHWGAFYKLALWATPGNHGNWMSFWGSYLGVISSGIIAFSVAKFEIDHSDEKERQRIIGDRYIKDLREMRNLLLKYRYNGTVPPLYRGWNVRLSQEEIIDLKGVFFNKKDINGETTYLTSEPWDIRLIVDTLPSKQREKFHSKINDLCENLEKFGQLDEEKFLTNDQLKQSMYENKLKLDDEYSKEAINLVQKISSNYNDLNKKIIDEMDATYLIL